MHRLTQSTPRRAARRAGGRLANAWQRWRKAHRESRGFSLSELVVTMFLATVISISAFHIHATFQSSLHRQDEITRIQGTMKVTRQMLERKIRPAGAGMVGMTSSVCGGIHQIGPFVIHNNNTIGVQDLSQGDSDNDPDWFEVMAADMNANGRLTKAHPVTSVIKEVDNPQNYAVNGLMGLRNENGICILMITSIKINNDGTGNLNYKQGGSDLWKCYNDAQWKQSCRNDVLQSNTLPAGSEILNFSSGSFALRIDDSQPAQPVLMMASGMAGGDPQFYTWQPVAANVEDMQIAVHVDNSVPSDNIGDEWVNTRDLTDAQLNLVRAVRISVVFRSSSEVSGWRSGRRPALEDRPQAAATDGYIRRVMTTVIKLRNMIEEPGP